MKQVLQNLRTGVTDVADVPCPVVGPGHLLVRTRCSLISAGTERSLVEFGQSSLLAKARSQPDKVRRVLEKVRTDGLLPTLEAVFSRLDEPLPLGYCNMGVVVEVGAGVTDFAPGDRVVSNGPHAEIVCVPQNLCAKVADEVSDTDAAFTVLSSIALQGIRLLGPTLGERFAVYGLGLIGLVAVQLLRAHGCPVLGLDLNEDRLKLAASLGADRVVPTGRGGSVAAANSWTLGQGVDGVLIAASASRDEIVHESAQMCRQRGRIVLVGVVETNLRRSDFYRKELSFQVSCSYGPGRYDDRYERGGQDYPFGFVRWTQQRNFQAILGAMEADRLQVAGLVTHRFSIAEAKAAYEVVRNDRNALGVILEYPCEPDRSPRVVMRQTSAPSAGRVTVGVTGAGNFARLVLLPAVAQAGARIKYVADLNAATAQHAARKFGAEQAVTDWSLTLRDPEVDAVLVAVGHQLHAPFVCEALRAGKHVFVEKPLATTADGLSQVAEAVAEAPDRLLMVGFNRRFSPHVVKLKQLLNGRVEPMCMSMTINAGAIPPDHWVHDPERGGGRIIGEGCHFIDLLAFLTGGPVQTVAATRVNGSTPVRDDKTAIVLGFADGSVGTVNYFANGSKDYPKETLEVFSDGRVFRLENFRRLVGFGVAGFRKFRTVRQDKGHRAEFAAFVERVRSGGPPLISFEELDNVTRATLAAVESARTGTTIHV